MLCLPDSKSKQLSQTCWFTPDSAE